jgi:hypothetical protein
MPRLRLIKSTEEEQVHAALNFKPTVDCINRLPDALRRWIMELETKCDPAGDLQRAVLAEGLCRELEGLLLQYKQENRRLARLLKRGRTMRQPRKTRG